MTADDAACLLRAALERLRLRAPTYHPLPSLVVGRHRRFYRSDVEAWLADVRIA